MLQGKNLLLQEHNFSLGINPYCLLKREVKSRVVSPLKTIIHFNTASMLIYYTLGSKYPPFYIKCSTLRGCLKVGSCLNDNNFVQIFFLVLFFVVLNNFIF